MKNDPLFIIPYSFSTNTSRIESGPRQIILLPENWKNVHPLRYCGDQI